METLESYIRSRHTKQTADNYIYTINHFLATNPSAKSFAYNNVVDYVESLTKRGLQDQTRVRILSAIKKYYDYLLETGQRNDHPCKSLVIRKRKKNIQLQDLFSKSELEMLFNRPNRYKLLDVRNKLLLSLLIYQGLSSDEIVKLNVSNLDLDNGTVYIKASHTLKSRTMELHRTQFNLLFDYLNTVRPKLLKEKTGSLIIGKHGGSITVDGIFAIVEPLKSLFPDRNLSPQTIRQSVISYWLNDKKLPLEDVQDLAGHRYPSATEKYKRIDVANKRKWINLFHPLG